MTERSLMIRCAVAGRYFAVGMDLPSARVFDVATGALAAFVELPPQSRTSLALISLTSLALGLVGERRSDEEAGELGLVNKRSGFYASVGLSNGTVLLHNVCKDEFVQHIAISDTQQAITATAFCGRYLFCLASNCFLHVADCLRVERIATNMRVQHDAGAIVVVSMDEDRNTKDSKQHGDGISVFHVFVSGSTNAVYRLCFTANVTEKTIVTLERLISFASHSSCADFAWMCSSLQRPVVVTAGAQEGVIRVWDASFNVDSQTALSRCRRSLLCGQRILNISVYNTTTGIIENNAGRNGNRGGDVFVVATTYTGAVLVWNLANELLTALAEPLPMPPTLYIVSKESSERLLFGAVLHDSEPNALSLLLLRGRFAVPQFEVLSLCEAESNAVKLPPTSLPVLTTAAAVVCEDVFVYILPAGKKSDNHDAAVAAAAANTDMVVVDNAWATHSYQQQKQQRQRHLLAARAIQTPTEGFAQVVSFHAKSVKDLPRNSLTLEQRLRQLSLSLQQQKQQNEDIPEQKQQPQQHALGLATVPLYQALHANDVSAVMELLTVASRSADDIRATVMSLQLPYCLQLLQIFAQRMRGATTRSPLFEWVDAIMHYRGVEMYQAQQLFKQQEGDKSTTDDISNKKVTAAQLQGLSAPKDFVSPLLHQYRKMVALYDSIASVYGRLSIFKSVRPSERGVFENSDTGIIFPAMFREVRCAGGVYRTIKVRSKHDKRLKNKNSNKKSGALALLRKARRLANASDENVDDIDSEENDDLELDIDTPEKEEDSETRPTKEEEEEKEDGTEMIAEDDRGSSFGVDSFERSSDADFDSASDDDDSSLAGDEDEEDDDDDSESSDSSDDDVVDYMLDNNEDEDDDDDNDDNEDDGLDDDMAELLHAQGEEEQIDIRRHKRVKTDR